MAAEPQRLDRPQAGSITSQFGRGAATPDYLKGLNEEQRDAVLTTEGPLLVLAGAGTGKTRVLTTRIAHILNSRKAWPSEILSVTFTNKAAREMKERIGALVGSGVEGMPWLGTFHSIGARLLRRHAELVGLRSDFTILDTDDQIRLIKQLLEAANIDEKRWPAKQFAGMMDNWKNRGQLPADVSMADRAAFANGRIPDLYQQYQDRLKTLNATDFGDLLLLCIKLFREYPDVLAEYHRRFKYILVDEYQDSNIAQYLWLRLLAQGKPASEANLCVVGDDDQSIYGWRGAEVDNILRFEHDFPGATVVRLERNYRSTGHILATAAKLIARNEGRLGKTLRTEDEAGEKVTITGAWDSQEEARLISDEIEAMQSKGENLSEVAILVRISAQMREMEERLIHVGVPYRVIGGPRFYERAEIRDAMAYLRCVVSPTDDLAFERIFNVPKRGLGDATIQLLHNHARATGFSLMQSARAVVETEELKPKARTALRELVEAFARWSGRAESMQQGELAELVLEESGYTEMWQKDRSADAAGRLENLKELVRSLDEFPDLPSFLEHVSLVMDADSGDGGARVSIMTLHAAKGLEFDTVFLPGWEEGLFPSQRALDENGRAGLEEERRLAHVGLTRARKRLKLYFASNRRIHGLWQSSLPSRFIDELPEDHVEVVQAPTAYSQGGYGASRFERMESFGSSYQTPGWQRAQENKAKFNSGGGSGFSEAGQRGFGSGSGRQRGPMLIEGELTAKSTGSSAFDPGARVFHVKFGPGSVASVDGNKLTVDFDKAGRKMVLDSFVQKAG